MSRLLVLLLVAGVAGAASTFFGIRLAPGHTSNPKIRSAMHERRQSNHTKPSNALLQVRDNHLTWSSDRLRVVLGLERRCFNSEVNQIGLVLVCVQLHCLGSTVVARVGVSAVGQVAVCTGPGLAMRQSQWRRACSLKPLRLASLALVRPTFRPSLHDAAVWEQERGWSREVWQLLPCHQRPMRPCWRTVVPDQPRSSENASTMRNTLIDVTNANTFRPGLLLSRDLVASPSTPSRCASVRVWAITWLRNIGSLCSSGSRSTNCL